MIFMHWIVVAIVLVAIEILTPGVFFFACLGFGALIAGLSVLLFPLWVAWPVFVIVSVLSIYTIRPLAKRLFVPTQKKSNVDALVGQKAWVTEATAMPQLGMVKVASEFWRAEADENIPTDTWVVVTAVNGTRLIVKKQ